MVIPWSSQVRAVFLPTLPTIPASVTCTMSGNVLSTTWCHQLRSIYNPRPRENLVLASTTFSQMPFLSLGPSASIAMAHLGPLSPNSCSCLQWIFNLPNTQWDIRKLSRYQSRSKQLCPKAVDITETRRSKKISGETRKSHFGSCSWRGQWTIVVKRDGVGEMNLLRRVKKAFL